MNRRLRAVAGSLIVVTGATGATVATKEPVFSVTVHATLEQHFSYTFVGQSDCTSGTVERRVTLRTVKPFTRQLSKLVADNGAFELAAQETRTVTPESRRACGPDERGFSAVDTSGCGTASYKVGSVGTAAGYMSNRSDRFRVYFSRIGPDPYGGRCFAVGEWVVGAVAGSAGRVSGESYPPPRVWGQRGRPSWVELDRSVLRSAKRYVVRWSDGAASPDDYHARDRRDDASWTVTLVRVR